MNVGARRAPPFGRSCAPARAGAQQDGGRRGIAGESGERNLDFWGAGEVRTTMPSERRSNGADDWA